MESEVKGRGSGEKILSWVLIMNDMDLLFHLAPAFFIMACIGSDFGDYYLVL